MAHGDSHVPVFVHLLRGSRRALNVSHIEDASTAADLGEDVWIVNSDGTGLKRLAEIAENQPSLAWTSDGSTLFAVGATAFWKIDAASGKAQQAGSGVPLGQIIWLGKS